MTAQAREIMYNAENVIVTHANKAQAVPFVGIVDVGTDVGDTMAEKSGISWHDPGAMIQTSTRPQTSSGLPPYESPFDDEPMLDGGFVSPSDLDGAAAREGGLA